MEITFILVNNKQSCELLLMLTQLNGDIYFKKKRKRMTRKGQTQTFYTNQNNILNVHSYTQREREREEKVQ